MVLTFPVLFAQSTTDATNTSSGSLQVSGGVGIVKNLYVGTNLTSSQLTSTVSSGTQPLIVNSSTLVPILYVARSLIADTTSGLTISGPITIAGTTSSITSQTGTGTVFVMNASPTLITPYIGSANGTSLTLLGSVTASLVNTSVILNGIQAGGILLQPTLVGYGDPTAWTPLQNRGLQIGFNNVGGTGAGAVDLLSNNQGGGNIIFTWYYTNSTNTGTNFLAYLKESGQFYSGQFFASSTAIATSVSSASMVSNGGLSANNMWVGSAYTGTNSTTSGSIINISPFTYTSSTLNPTNFNTVTIDQVTLNSVGIASTTTNAASLYVAGPPTSSGLMNIANPFSFGVQTGSSYFANSSGLGSLSCTWLIVGGGGAGGATSGGGGGAGGYVLNSTPTALTGSYQIIVGAGGGGSTGAAGLMGNPSAIGTILAVGGGGGGQFLGNGIYGGSGGGAGGTNAGTHPGGVAYTGGQGTAGGSSNFVSSGAGGGGAGAVGSSTTTNVAGAGGAGSTTSISGSSVTYAGGGGGGNSANSSNGAGGSGGGGAGATNSGTAVAGTANTGGGGGGDGNNNIGAAGGSGIVIISYTGTIAKATGGTITTSGSNVIHKFTSSGTFTILNNPITTTGSVAIAGTVSIAGPLYLGGTNLPMPNIYSTTFVGSSSTIGTAVKVFPISPVFITGFPIGAASNGDYSANSGFYPISCALLNSSGITPLAGDVVANVALTYSVTNTNPFKVNLGVTYFA